ncbi:hypothetical protein [Streptomyces sp. NBC_01264]|uniref:hypothetical protein n=1 Tax=Streptomyces sp. NBC_01264 TaxID=2903804 RepID=UPI00225BEB2A|nr:hypothetical protein [Streptomyces sp. NBC_01264]MCX4784647.1 hypothetical protein [Streptomyces sp. NBC_01264]
MKEIRGVVVTPMTYVATFFTAVSLAWTGYSITDLMASGAWGLLAAVSVDGLWGVVQYLDYKGIGGRTVQVIGWITLAAACGLLGYHGHTINPAAAVAGALPPIVAKAAWIGDIRLRRDPTALEPSQEAEINDVIRESEYIARKTAAEIERNAAAEIALIRAEGRVTLARDDVNFEIGLERLRKRDELERRRPLELAPVGGERWPARFAPDANDGANVHDGDGDVRPDDTEVFADLVSDIGQPEGANGAGESVGRVSTFGFGAVLAEANGPARQANATTGSPANGSPRRANDDSRESAAADYLASVRAGEPLTGAELGRRYGRTARWGQKVIAGVKEV